MTTPLDEFNKRFPVGGGPPTTTSTLDEEARRILDAFNAKFPVGGAGVSPPPSGEPLVPSPAPGEVPTQDRPDSEIMQWIQQQSEPQRPQTPEEFTRQVGADPTRLKETPFHKGPARRPLETTYKESRKTEQAVAELLREVGLGIVAPAQIDPNKPFGQLLAGELGIGDLRPDRLRASLLEAHQERGGLDQFATEAAFSPLNFVPGLGGPRLVKGMSGARFAFSPRSLLSERPLSSFPERIPRSMVTHAVPSAPGTAPLGAPFEPSLIVVDAAHPQGERLIFGNTRAMNRGGVELGQREGAIRVLSGDAPQSDVLRAASELGLAEPPAPGTFWYPKRVGKRGVEEGQVRPGVEVTTGGRWRAVESAPTPVGVEVTTGGITRRGVGELPSGRQRTALRGEEGGVQSMLGDIRQLQSNLTKKERQLTGILKRKTRLNKKGDKLGERAAEDEAVAKRAEIRQDETALTTLENNYNALQAGDEIVLTVKGVIRTEPSGLHDYPGSTGRKRVGELPSGVSQEIGPRGKLGDLRSLSREQARNYYAANTPQKAKNFKSAVRQEGVDPTVGGLDNIAKADTAKVIASKAAKPPSQPPTRPPGQPAGVDDPPPRRSADALTDDMDLPTWEASRQGIMRKWEAARAAEGADTTLWFDEGASLTERLGIATFDEATMDPVFLVLHGEAPRESLTPPLQEIHDFVKGMQALEEREMLEFLGTAQNTSPNFLSMDAENFASKMMAHPNYFPRGWSQGGKPLSDMKSPFGLVSTPRFTRKRVDASYSDLRSEGLTPRSWNPIAMMAERRIHGVEYRENVVMMNRLFKEGLAKNADVTPANMMDDAALKGWRIPQIGHLFQGRPILDDTGEAALSSPIYVPNYVANLLEQVYHPPISDTMKRVRWFTNGLKGVKLAGSLFQHVDILQRAVGSGLSPTGIKRLAPIRYPSLLKDVFATQFSPRSRKALRTKMLSTDRVRGVKNFGLTYRMLVEEGLNLQADTSIIQREMVDFLDTTPKRILPVQKLKELNDWWQSGLFEGVYLSAQKWSLENFIIPHVRRTRPNATPRQVAAEASEAANLIFSTPTRSQSIFTDPTMRKYLENLFFSINENESLLRLGARAASTNPRAGLAREQVMGTLTAMVVVSNAMNYAATGEVLPPAAYSPVNLKDPYAFFGVGYENKFLSPVFPGVTGSAGQPIHVDVMGQMDTPLRVADPFAFISSRLNVSFRALVEASAGETFFGQELDTFPKRAAYLAQSLGSPIGVLSGMGAVVERFPAVQEYLARGESRLGTGGQLLQASGINLRSATTEDVIKRNFPDFDDLPETLRKGQGGNSKAQLRRRMNRVLSGAVRSDPLFPGLVFKEGRPQFLEEQKVEREVEAIRKQYGGR
jgi:hypothetical protein